LKVGKGRLDAFAAPSRNDRYLRIPSVPGTTGKGRSGSNWRVRRVLRKRSVRAGTC